MPKTRRAARARLEATIEAAIALLDQMDGDPDLEDEPIEPSGEEDIILPSWVPQRGYA